MAKKIEKEEIEVLETKWKERERGSGRDQVLKLEIKGIELEVPVSNIDHPNIKGIWEADWVYLYNNEEICVEKYYKEDQRVKLIEYELNNDGFRCKGGIELKFIQQDETPTPGQIVWSRSKSN